MMLMYKITQKGLIKKRSPDGLYQPHLGLILLIVFLINRFSFWYTDTLLS